MARFSLVLGSEGSCVSSELYIQKDELAKHTPILIASYGFVWPSSLRVPQPGLPNNTRPTSPLRKCSSTACFSLALALSPQQDFVGQMLTHAVLI